MEMVYCPGCACDAHYSQPACPVCGAPHATLLASLPQRNPFTLIALCVLYAVAIWFGALFLVGFASGGGAPGPIPSGPLLFASICLSIALTVRGKLPGTARPLRPTA